MKLTAFFSREQLMLSVREILSRFFQAALVSLILTVYIIYKIIIILYGRLVIVVIKNLLCDCNTELNT